jgi:hypothetical protein
MSLRHRNARHFRASATVLRETGAGVESIVLTMFRPGRVAALCALAALAAVLLFAVPATASAQGQQRRVVVAFYTAYPTDVLAFEGAKKPYEPQDTFLRFLGSKPQLQLGLWSSIQGEYTQPQAALDVTQGTRQSTALYTPRKILNLPFDQATSSFPDWPMIRSRAKKVSVTIKPGLLAGSIPGGGAYAGVKGESTVPAIAAANEQGRVNGTSFGSVGTLAQRAQQLSRTRRLVVVGVPPTAAGRAQLDQLIAGRPADEMLMVAQLPPSPPDRAITRPPPRYFKQPAFAIQDGGTGSPTSGTTRRDGLISAIDFAPTALDWLGIDAPKKMRGEVIESGSAKSAKDLEKLRRRWTDVRGARQSSSFRAVVALAGVIFLIIGAIRGIDAALGPALRLAALGLMWWPTMVLAAAALQPQARLVEAAFIASTSILLAAITDRLLRWPRGPIAPVAVALVAYTADLATGGELLTRSALGPSVAFGARFYGISNELEPLLPILLLTGLAAALTGHAVTRRTPVIYAVAGFVLAVIVGWGRLGADVGGVITVGMGVAVATLVMLPGGITKRSLVVAALVPVAAIGFLILIDLGLSGGDHLSRNLLRTENGSELWELVSRRYELAFRVLKSGRTPAYFLAAALGVAFALKNRHWLYANLPHRAWLAVLVGGLAAGVAGTLTNDSGPVLLVNAVLALAGVTAYILGGTRSKAVELEEQAEAEARSGAGPPKADPVLSQ